MTSYQWIKLYDDILDDPKMGRLSDGAYRFCINLLLLANRHPLRDGSLPDIRDVAWILRLSSEAADSHLKELTTAGIVEFDGTRLFLPQFSNRQRSTDANVRMQQYRDRKRAGVTREVTDSDDNGYAGVTNRNAEKRREEEKRGEERRGRKDIPPQIWSLITAISAVCAQTYSESTNHQEFEDAAYSLEGHGITADDLTEFGKWWARGNGFHNDAPFIKNILSQIRAAKKNGWSDTPKATANNSVLSATWEKVCDAVSKKSFDNLTDTEKQAIKTVGMQNIRMRDTYTEPKLKAAFYEAIK